MPLGRLVCSNHAERIARAACVGCQKPLCAECATPWEGIHLCAACLARRRAAEVRRGSVVAWMVWTGATSCLFLAAPRLMTWAGVLVLGR